MDAASDGDSQYEDGTEGDEASRDDVLDGPSDSLEIDEPSFVDSHEDLHPSSSESDDESID